MKESHPWFHEQMINHPGAWIYQRQDERGFNGLAADQSIETTVNRESKTPGGIIGITMNRGEQWQIKDEETLHLNSFHETWFHLILYLFDHRRSSTLASL